MTDKELIKPCQSIGYVDGGLTKQYTKVNNFLLLEKLYFEYKE